ncbi:MAG: hypothetical protein EXR77_01605 [Myxococcales bacterium]|nr:hypothetical protein [Myxococcales bacterium]
MARLLVANGDDKVAAAVLNHGILGDDAYGQAKVTDDPGRRRAKPIRSQDSQSKCTWAGAGLRPAGL